MMCCGPAIHHCFLFGLCASALAIAQPALADCDVTPSSAWKNTVEFSNDPFRYFDQVGDPSWVKFTILTCDPTVVYYQCSGFSCSPRYLFHSDFATEVLDPFLGMTLEEYNQVSLYAAGQEAILGVVIFPPTQSGDPTTPAFQEYGIQLVRHDAYTPQEVVDIFNTVVAAVIAGPGVTPLYFPAYSQQAVADEHADWLASQGVIVTSPSRWAEGNVCYSQGWALGRLRYIPTDEIDAAYLAGTLMPDDILLTDAVPAEIPYVAGVISLAPSTPSSHVAILASTYEIPFAHLARTGDVNHTMSLLDHRIVLRAYGTSTQADVQLIDTESKLTPETADEILALKAPAELGLTPIATLGAYSDSVENLFPEDVQYFGGKAANYSLLREAIPDSSPIAMAFSFDLWNAFLDQPTETGNTLRDEITARLSGYTYPPDLPSLTADLQDIRDLISEGDVVFPHPLREEILAALQDPQHGFDLSAPIRFRSSTNVEDSEHFTGAGLYESHSGCVEDELDGDATIYISSWPCAAAVGKDDAGAWRLSTSGDAQSSYLSANGDLGSPGVFVDDACPIGACCIAGTCIETTRTQCTLTHGGSYQGDGTSCAAISCPLPGTGRMRITEYMYSGGGGEFIEFTNVGTEPIDMTGWSFDDESRIPGTQTLSVFGVVAPGASVILTEDAASTFANDWSLSGIPIIGSLAANLGRADEINLYDADDALVDRLTYGDEVFPGSIRTRDAAGWPCDLVVGENNIYGWSLATSGDAQGSVVSINGDIGSPGLFVADACPAGACCVDGECIDTTRADCLGVHLGAYQGDGSTCAGVTCPASGLGRMRITEYMYRGTGGEFVEFTNLGETAVDMTGWSFDDESAIPGTVDLSGYGIVMPGESVILTEDTAVAFAEDWGLTDIKIIGGLTENLGRSDTIHLFDASGVLVDRLAYAESDGPSRCDPARADGQGVFQAIRDVYASFYNDNAFIARLRYGVDESTVGMGVLVHHSFPDAFELANGVATLAVTEIGYEITLVSQAGAVSVTNPEPGLIPEEVQLWESGDDWIVLFITPSALVPLGGKVLDWTSDYEQLADLLVLVAERFEVVTGKTQYRLDFEYKKVAPGGAAMPTGGLVVKQVRELPQPDTTPNITPFLINDPTDWEQIGEGYKGLGGAWRFETRNCWLTSENIAAGSLLTSVSMMTSDGCGPFAYDGPFAELPQATYSYDEAEAQTHDSYTLEQPGNTRTVTFTTFHAGELVSAADCPIRTLHDLTLNGKLELRVEHETPVITWLGYPLTESVSTAYVAPPYDPDDPVMERTRTYDLPGGGTIVSEFEAIPPPAGTGWRPVKLARMIETTIEGLSTEPIVLRNSHAHVWSAGDHNWYENLVLEPLLEPGLSPRTRDELLAQDIHLIDVFRDMHTTWETTITYYSAADLGISCEPCLHVTPGDLTGDGAVDVSDVDGFVGVLVSGPLGPSETCAADLNGDAIANGDDIGPFVAMLLEQ